MNPELSKKNEKLNSYIELEEDILVNLDEVEGEGKLYPTEHILKYCGFIKDFEYINYYFETTSRDNKYLSIYLKIEGEVEMYSKDGTSTSKETIFNEVTIDLGGYQNNDDEFEYADGEEFNLLGSILMLLYDADYHYFDVVEEEIED